MNVENVIVTDWGTFEAPQWFVDRWNAVRKRKDGRPDRRFNLGKNVIREERALIREFSPRARLEML